MAADIAASPRIANFTWGRIETADGRAFRDAKLWPGGGREWDWAETGTHHAPGIQPADVMELLEHGAETVVLSRGVYKRLQTCVDTRDLLAREGVAVHILQTELAVERYNALAQTGPVGGLFHSTC
ncbi:MAG: Mth938-like domain-containing protein [Alphaproteobacteria bacterium]|nr:Mth938-like domain-containing protein [Alphaproteobacteria bacterium]